MASTLTENTGGTDASFPVSFARVVTGIIALAFGAGGWRSEEAKKVACSVAAFAFQQLGVLTQSRITY